MEKQATEEKKKTDPNKLFPKGGIVVGMDKVGDAEKLYYIADDTHTITIGAARSGKYKNVCFPLTTALYQQIKEAVLTAYEATDVAPTGTDTEI